MPSTMEAERGFNPSLQSPIGLEVAGKAAPVAVAFDAQENPNDPDHAQEEQTEVRAEEEKLVTDKSNLGKPVDGLAVTAVDGVAWYVKTTVIEKGESLGCLHLLGQVDKDTYLSACTAYRFAMQLLLQKQSDNTFFENSSLALNLPRCHGPSAGCTFTTSLLSLAIKKHVKKDIAMTGVIDQTGMILQVDGVKEKTIGARRSQLKTIIFPEANRGDFEELSQNMKEGLDVHFVDEYEQIFR